MPESRPLTQSRQDTTNHDDPPATAESSTPYPNRHSRLRRALRTTSGINTNDLARDIGRERSATAARSSSAWGAFRNRRRMRDSREDDDEEEDEAQGEQQRRPKRRKLCGESGPAVRAPIKYGHFGQVEPGRLRMEIISCDGGEHTDPRSPEVYLGAKNLLKADKSVYCSERTSAGVLLRHLDNTPFCLEKVHIVGPEHGFTAPVREGLIYVAMNIQDLQPYQDPPFHARRTGIHEPPYPPTSAPLRRDFRASPERLTLSDALNDPEIIAAADLDTTHSRDLDDESDPYGEPLGVDFNRDPHCDYPSSRDSPSLSPAADSDPNHPTTILLSDDSAGDEDPSSQEVLDYRSERSRIMRRRTDASAARDDGWHSLARDQFDARMRADDRWRDAQRERRDATRAAEENPWSLSRLEALMQRRRRRGGRRGEESGGDGNGAGDSAVMGGEDGEADEKVRVARFRIPRGRFSVAVKFDPGVSGRYVLVKMWAGGGGGRGENVDCQSLVLKGFGGCRFFPAVEVR